MSSHGITVTQFVPAGLDPGIRRTPQEIDAAPDRFDREADRTIDGFHYVRNLSRGGWSVLMMEGLLPRHPLSALQFLTHSGQVTLDLPDGPLRRASVLAVRDTARKHGKAVLHFVDEPI